MMFTAEGLIGTIYAVITTTWPMGKACLVVVALHKKYAPKDLVLKIEMKHELNAIAMKKAENPVRVRLHEVQQRTLCFQSCYHLSKAPRLDAKADLNPHPEVLQAPVQALPEPLTTCLFEKISGLENRYNTSLFCISLDDQITTVLDKAPVEYSTVLTCEQRSKGSALTMIDLEEAMKPLH
eukprot:15367177-Ditylum_brightwellii.AAC.2